MTLNPVRATLAFLLLGILQATSQAGTATFGSGANTFTMDFTTIGNPGNAADTAGDPNPAGSVGYTYQIGTYDVSRDMITKYNSAFGTANSLEVSLWDMTNLGGNGASKPATGVSWHEAARFVNWLNTSTGNHAAYKFTTGGVNDEIAKWDSSDAGYDASNPYRNSLATYVLPSDNEWYKAAYYDPNKNGGAGGYWTYTTGSDSVPTAVASGTTANTAVYGQSFNQGPAEVGQSGGLSAYGVMGLGGNVWQWQESSPDEDLTDSQSGHSGQVRGGWWFASADRLSSSVRLNTLPQQESRYYGLRVVSLDSPASVVPEPSMMVIGSILGIGGLIAKRRMKKRSN
ncbi:MAG: SUMF1/EgtB/PvdO family nonheme iron enzyme [Planctomycetota bacterium]